MGLQHTWQSSMYSWCPTEASTTIAIDSPQYGHAISADSEGFIRCRRFRLQGPQASFPRKTMGATSPRTWWSRGPASLAWPAAFLSCCAWPSSSCSSAHPSLYPFSLLFPPDNARGSPHLLWGAEPPSQFSTLAQLGQCAPRSSFASAFRRAKLVGPNP